MASSFLQRLHNLPEDIVDKIYVLRYNEDIQIVHKELQVVRPTYPGDFSNQKDDFMRQELTNAYQVITDLNSWEFMKKRPPQDSGYMFWNNASIMEIKKEIDKRSGFIHSGNSLAYVLRHMHYIAENGWTMYYYNFISSLNEQS